MMPKYYRFRATTPTRKPKRCRDKDKEKEHIEKAKSEVERDMLAMILAPAGSSWYSRRTSWREANPLMTLPHLPSGFRNAMLTSNRQVFMLKLPFASEYRTYF